MATISNTPRPGYVWDSTDNCWYPIGTGPHSHADYITSSSAINPNIVDAKGDIIAATAADTPARLAVGSNDQVLTADSSTATGLKWATPSSSTYVQLATGTLSSTTVSITSISGSYTDLRLWVYGVAVGSNEFYSIRVNSNTGSIYKYDLRQIQTATVLQSNGATSWNELGRAEPGTNNFILLDLYNYASTTLDKMGYINTKRAADFFAGNLAAATTSAISSIQLIASGGQSFSAGTYVLYGVK